MFGIPGKTPVTISAAAVRQIERLMAGGEIKGLRIGVKKGGCAGMEYTILDDFHFKNAGLDDSELFSHYVTEDDAQVAYPALRKLSAAVWTDAGNRSTGACPLRQRCGSRSQLGCQRLLLPVSSTGI